MADLDSLAAFVGGTRRLEAQSANPADTQTVYAVAASDSDGGSVAVDFGDYVTLPDADEARQDGTEAAGGRVTVPTTVSVREGQTVVVTLVGNHPMVTGVVGVGDRQQGEIDSATDYASRAKDAADKAQASADKAQASADKAQASADKAQASADKAGEAAQKAISDAAAAHTAATDAQADAKSAQTSADKAASAASDAKASADTANASATKAISDAAAASTAAKSAQADATSASTSAASAGKAAATAQAAAEAAQGDIDETQTWFYHDALGAHVLSSTGGATRTDVLPDGMEVVDATDQSVLAHFGTDGARFPSGRDFSLGSDDAHVRYDASADELSISAKSITIGSSDVASSIADAKSAGTTAQTQLSSYKTSNDKAVADAKSAGTTAQTQLNSYKTSNDKAVADAKSAGTTAQTQLSSYKTSNDKAVKAASDAAGKAQQAADGISVGGRNLIRTSGNFASLAPWVKNGPDTTVFEVATKDGFSCIHANNGIRQDATYHLEGGTEYVWRGVLWSSVPGSYDNRKPLHYWIYRTADRDGMGPTNGAAQSVVADAYDLATGARLDTIPASTWVHIVCRFKTKAATSEYPYVNFRPFLYGSIATASGADYYLRWCKLERGNRATDWTPAPEDVDASVSAVDERLATVERDYVTSAKLTTTKESIEADVSSTLTEAKTYTDGRVGAEVTDRNAAIKASADSVTSAVAKTYQTKADAQSTYATKTALTQTADSIRLEAGETYATKTQADATDARVDEWASRNSSLRRVFTDTPKPPYDLGDLWARHPVEEVGRTHNELSAYTHDALSSYNEEGLTGDGELTDLYVCTTARATGDYVMGDWEAATTLGEEFRMMRATYATHASLEVTNDSIMGVISGQASVKGPDGATYDNAVATVIRQYGSGVLVAKTGQAYGALVNASGSFDVVTVSWSGTKPTVGSTVARFDASSVSLMNGRATFGTSSVTLNSGALTLSSSGADATIRAQQGSARGTLTVDVRNGFAIKYGATDANGLSAGTHNLTRAYRLYNPNDGQHVWTASITERNSLVNAGWTDEKVGFWAFT